MAKIDITKTELVWPGKSAKRRCATIATLDTKLATAAAAEGIMNRAD